MKQNLTTGDVLDALQAYVNRHGSSIPFIVRNEDGTEWPIQHVTLERDDEGGSLHVVLE